MSRTLYPLSVDLQGKPVLVAGGGSVAARKLTELLRCGADVTVVAPEISAAVARLAPALRLERRPFRPGDEAGKYLVFACADEPAANREIAALCRRANILCNVADAAEAGSFHVPGVIRQGNVTVTVATGGAAPGLTRHLKRLLSGALGPEVAEAAALLSGFRSRLKSSGAPGSAAVLETLPYRALLEALKAGDRARAEALLAEAAREAGPGPARPQGRKDAAVEGAPAETASGPDPVEGPRSPASGVTPGAAPDGRAETGAASTGPAAGTARALPGVDLVGAGPGHPGLLTLLGADILRRAEVIIHDRLIPEEVLQLAPAECRLVPAGKRGHFESVRQEEIEAQLIEHALAGKRVVRLKGGDPFVYGRGWEEALALQARGIPWRVIPGVSSTTAGPAWAGIPLTHRGVARSFAVMSGMAYSATNTEIPKADTIVLVMGLQRLAEIVPAFLAQGWDPATPAAAIQNATLPDQRVCFSTLEGIREETSRRGFDSPTLLVIGKVAGLAARKQDDARA
jgi:uroporphyrin-III C-methyltransferase/precorrin-2 dehydrogenase/sirohydrochlorin ferrochelatase